MSFSRVNALGWAVNEELTSTQMNDLDTNVSKAVDGDAGGTYSPSAPIDIDGAGGGAYALTVENLQFDGADGTFFNIVNGGRQRIRSGGELQVDDGGKAIFKGDGDDNLPNLEKSATTDPRTYVYQQSLGAGFAGSSSSGSVRWTFNATSSGVFWTQFDTTSAFKLVVPIIMMPARATLNSVTLYLNGGSAGGHSSLPATMPKATLWQSSTNGGTTVDRGSVTDPSGSTAAYDSDHSMSISGLSLPFNEGISYYVEIEGETGANSVDSALHVTSMQVNCDVSKIGP